MRRRSFISGAAACGLGLATPVQANPTSVLGGRAFGSYWRVVLGGAAERFAITQRIRGIVASVDAAMSPYRPDTEISRLNDTDTIDWIRLSGPLWAVLDAALVASRRTNGAFDPTVGGIVGRYGFGPIRSERVGSAADLELREGAVRKRHGAMSIDLCGIAKGWALDLIVADLLAMGHRDFVAELGGEVVARGRHPGGRAWRIAVEDPGAVSQTLALRLDDKAVATSGAARQGYRIGTRRYGHIIDPRSGMAATGDLVSVSVASGTATEADALATALFALGGDEAGAMAHALGLDVLMLLRDGAAARRETFGAIDGWLV